MTRGAVPFLLAALLTVLAGCARSAPPPPARRSSDIPLASDTLSITGRFPRNATLASVLRGQEMREEIIPEVVSLAGRVFDARRFKADHAFRLVRTLDGLLRLFEYEVDADSFLRIMAAVGDAGAQPKPLTAEIVKYRKERALVSVRGEINSSASSLFAAMEVLGEGPDLSLALAEIFGGEIDFHSDLQPGDTFALTFEKVFRDGQFAGYGPVQAAEFANRGRMLKAIRFTPPGGKPGYYDEQGRSMRRFFLASPLKFILSPRVKSRFTSARYHPILRIYRPHLGVDYRAPMGSPVVAVAAGTVLSAGWSGGGGRMVHLRHASGYETYYMHLSAITVRAGAHVGQGELIGRVGSTGMSTGPHLDYRVHRNGRAINPQNLLRLMPPGDPIPAALFAQFRVERDYALSHLVEPVPAVPAAAPAAAQ